MATALNKPRWYRTRGMYWIGWQKELMRDGWLVNCFTIGLFIPADWVWKVRKDIRTKLPWIK